MGYSKGPVRSFLNKLLRKKNFMNGKTSFLSGHPAKSVLFILVLLHLFSVTASCAPQRVGGIPQGVEDAFLPDSDLYFTSSNRDGRGKPLPGDDKIYRIVPLRK